MKVLYQVFFGLSIYHRKVVKFVLKGTKKEHRFLDAHLIFIMNPHGLLRTPSPDVTLAASSAQAPSRHTKGPA